MSEPAITLKEPLPRPHPRRISDGSLESVLLVFNLIWLAGSLLAIFLAVISAGPDWYRYWRLRQSGALAAGQVLRHDLGRNWHAYIYEFAGIETDNRGPEPYLGQQSVRAGQYQPLPPGEAITVRYLPSDPNVSVIEPFFHPPSRAPLLYVTMGLLVFAGGGLLLPGRWRDWYRIYRLRTHGQVTSAKIINRWRAVERRRNRDQYCVAYQFDIERADGTRQTVLTAEDNQLAYRTLQIGQRSPVRYWPPAPQQCWLELGKDPKGFGNP